MEHTFTLLSLLLCQVTFLYLLPLPFSISLSLYLTPLFPFSTLYRSLFAAFFSLSHSLSHIHTHSLSHTLFVVFSFISFFYLFRQWPALGPTRRVVVSAEEVSWWKERERASLSIRYLPSTQKTYLRQGSEVLTTCLMKESVIDIW